jgi:hypothetical protein
MKTNLLATAAVIGAPFMGIGVYVEAYNLPLNQFWWTDFWGLMYITGWLAGMEVMRRLALTGYDRFGQAIIPVVMSTLVLGMLSNVWHLVAPSYQPTFFWVLDTCWPLSHVLMLGVGVAVLRAKKLTGFIEYLFNCSVDRDGGYPADESPVGEYRGGTGICLTSLPGFLQ